ncbi:hypothetical protein FMUND_10038 [Fusarium mundagurra]|uniref:C2H2-type domain-containing protein n=1 Tax=Fusarium mundagurra TaxID=1567541 RepID=A0A8H5YBH6_9HYPO|nr:hypothetical protein FMUND_10038 [Fusarium mundagurra]
MSIDGLLASLIYLDDTRSSTTHIPNAELWDTAPWQYILDFRIEVNQYWDALANITQTQDLPGLDSLLEAFPTPVQLYEAAIFTFRNMSTGSEPDSLENVFALCSLSYVASICSQRMGKPDIDNIFRDVNIWRDSISDPQHRQLFNGLIQRLWGGNGGDMRAYPFQTEQSHCSASQPFNGPGYISPQSATMQDISLFGDFPDPFWGGLFDVPGSLPGHTFQMTGTTPEFHPTVLDTPEPQLLVGDLRQSAVITILTSFIANCGDLMDILSGHGATARGPHSDVPLEVKNFTQALGRHDSFGDPFARGILAVVDKFVDLNYFQNVDEVQDYIMIVGKEILPGGQIFAKVCKAVYSSTYMTKTSQVARRQHGGQKRYHVTIKTCKLRCMRYADGVYYKIVQSHASQLTALPMEAGDPFKDAISAIDGLFASFIYLDKTSTEMSTTFHDGLCHQIDRYWERLGQIASTQTIPNFTPLFNSFNSSTHFCEVAIFTFRNVLVGAKPESLHDIFSLCSFSYIASCCLQNHDNFRDLDVWQSAIRNPQERQLFSDVAAVVWPPMPSIATEDACKSQTPPTVLCENPPTQSSSDELWYMQDETLLNGLPDLFWGLEATNNSGATIVVEELLPTSSTLEDLQRSAIVSNLICFLTECGDLLHVFSGRGVTTKDLYSCIAFTQRGSEARNVVNSCVQRLKSHGASQNPAVVAIISIVERFVELGYLQTPEELRKYMLCVGRRVMFEEEAFATFCQSVCESTATVSKPPTPPRGRGRCRGLRQRLIPGREISCEVCGQLFSRKYNKNRHVEAKHPRVQLSPDADGLVQGSVRLTA